MQSAGPSLQHTRTQEPSDDLRGRFAPSKVMGRTSGVQVSFAAPFLGRDAILTKVGVADHE